MGNPGEEIRVALAQGPGDDAGASVAMDFLNAGDDRIDTGFLGLGDDDGFAFVRNLPLPPIEGLDWIEDVRARDETALDKIAGKPFGLGLRARRHVKKEEGVRIFSVQGMPRQLNQIGSPMLLGDHDNLA